MSIQDNIKPIPLATEPLDVALPNCAHHPPVPMEAKCHLLEVKPDVLKRVNPTFCDELSQGVFTALGLS